MPSSCVEYATLWSIFYAYRVLVVRPQSFDGIDLCEAILIDDDTTCIQDSEARVQVIGSEPDGILTKSESILCQYSRKVDPISTTTTPVCTQLFPTTDSRNVRISTPFLSVVVHN